MQHHYITRESYLHMLQMLLQFPGLFMLCTDLDNLHSSIVPAQLAITTLSWRNAALWRLCPQAMQRRLACNMSMKMPKSWAAERLRSSGEQERRESRAPE